MCGSHDEESVTDVNGVTGLAGVRLSVLGFAAERTMWALSLPAWTITSDQACASVDTLLHSDTGSMHTSLVVIDPDSGRVGSLSRHRFEQALSGRYGFGRALLVRTPVAGFTDWDTNLLPGSVTLNEAVQAVLSRPEQTRYDDLLLHRTDRGQDEWRRLPAGAVLEALAVSMARRASRDELTGLLNRSAFLEYLHEMALDERDTGRRIAVMFIDLDRMKMVNDTLGHDVGDALLRSVAGSLNAAARQGDLVGRLGGDEFAIAFGVPAIDERETGVYVGRVAHRYLAELRKPDLNLDPRARSRASIGAAVSSGSGPVEVENLLREADVAMYAAKQAGGDRVSVADNAQTTARAPAPSRSRVQLPDLSVERALFDNELILLYQPIVDVHSGRITSLEALLRWQHPSRGLLGAEQVLTAAASEHALIALDAWVLRTALGRLKNWIDLLGEHAPGWINVNLSPSSVANPHLAATVLAATTDMEVPPQRLRLELPETTAELTATSADELAALVEAGVQLALDDVGSGTSGLASLSTLSISEMKIDRSFISRMHVDARARTVIDMLVKIAAGRSIEVTAEGVESAQQLRRLKELGIDCVQGFYVCPPLSASADATDELLTAVSSPQPPSRQPPSRQPPSRQTSSRQTSSRQTSSPQTQPC
jgi:diguanylate cyclase (GGDEF)-like protein